MKSPVIYKGRGTPEMYDDLMDFLNYVFGFDGNSSDFKKILPKLYKKEADPTYHNYVVTENGKLKAAVGAFESTVSFGGKKLTCRGIGNVAVHPYARGKGYMKDCMNMALKGMLEDGIDFSALGGQRQRYHYFGYDHLGSDYHINITPTNLRHIFRDAPAPTVELHPVKEEEAKLLDPIAAMQASRLIHTVRDRKDFYDICCSFASSATPLWAVIKNGVCVGYFLNSLKELTLTDMADFNDTIRAYVASRGKVTLIVPSWNRPMIDAGMKLCENASLGITYSFNILNYRNVLSAILPIQAEAYPAAKGTLSVLIHGYAGDTCLRLTVENGTASVEEIPVPAVLPSGMMELTHLDAMQFFFGLYSPYRRQLPPALAPLFPLPIHLEEADHI